MSGTGSRLFPIILYNDDYADDPPPVAPGTKDEPIVISSDEENEQEEVEQQRFSTLDSIESRSILRKQYFGDSLSGYSFDGTGVAYNIMLSMGYSPGKGLGPDMKAPPVAGCPSPPLRTVATSALASTNKENAPAHPTPIRRSRSLSQSVFNGTEMETSTANGSSYAAQLLPPDCHSPVVADISLPGPSNYIRPVPSISRLPCADVDLIPKVGDLLEEQLRIKLVAKKQLATLEVALCSKVPSVVSLATIEDVDLDKQTSAKHEEEPTPPPLPTPTSTAMYVDPRPLCSSDTVTSQLMDSRPDDPQSDMTASLDTLATSFITETIHSARKQASTHFARDIGLKAHVGIAKSTVPSKAGINHLAAKRQMLARHIAKGKLLMNKYKAASTKEEKDKVRKLLKEQNQLMEASKPLAGSMSPPPIPSAPKFLWPQYVDPGILIISDDEDNM